MTPQAFAAPVPPDAVFFFRPEKNEPQNKNKLPSKNFHPDLDQKMDNTEKFTPKTKIHCIVFSFFRFYNPDKWQRCRKK